MYLLGQKYLEMLPALAAGKGSTVFLPAEAAGMLGALGGIREMLTRTSAGSNAEPAKQSLPPVPSLLARNPGDFPPGFGG
jgi:hypothetical protein